MKKTIYSLALAFIFLLGLTSCDMISGIKITDQGSIDKMLRSKIEKHVDPQSSVFEITLLTTADFSEEMNIVTITYFSSEANEVKQLNINIPGNQEPREVNVSSSMKERTAESGIKLSDIDFSKIASNINKGAEIMKEDEMELSGINLYRMSFNANPANTRHSFFLRSKAGSEFGTQNGRAALVTEYYEVQFSADAEGNVTVVE